MMQLGVGELYELRQCIISVSWEEVQYIGIGSAVLLAYVIGS